MSPEAAAASQIPDMIAHAQRDVHRRGLPEPRPRLVRNERPHALGFSSRARAAATKRPAARPAAVADRAPTAAPESFEPRPSSSAGNGAEAGATPGATTPPSVELPIPGYDALSASQVVERLTGLSTGELDTVRAYEGAHRRRRTILGKIEQLTASSG